MFFDELATEATLKSEDIEFCGECQTKNFKNFKKEDFLGKDCDPAKEKGLAFG